MFLLQKLTKEQSKSIELEMSKDYEDASVAFGTRTGVLNGTFTIKEWTGIWYHNGEHAELIGAYDISEMNMYSCSFQIYLLKQYRRKGYATAILKRLIDLQFKNTRYMQIRNIIYTGNEASEKAHLAAGFIHEATIHRTALINGTTRDSLFYTITRENWGKAQLDM